MSAILHCIVTDIENSRMKDQLRAWKAKTDADPLIQKIRRLEATIRESLLIRDKLLNKLIMNIINRSDSDDSSSDTE